MQEWGRSSLALVDVREETKRLSDELEQLRLAGGGGGGSGRSRGGSNKPVELGSETMEQLLRGVEEKVGFFVTCCLLRTAVCSDAAACAFVGFWCIFALSSSCAPSAASPCCTLWMFLKEMRGPPKNSFWVLRVVCFVHFEV